MLEVALTSLKIHCATISRRTLLHAPQPWLKLSMLMRCPDLRWHFLHCHESRRRCPTVLWSMNIWYSIPTHAAPWPGTSPSTMSRSRVALSTVARYNILRIIPWLKIHHDRSTIPWSKIATYRSLSYCGNGYHTGDSHEGGGRKRPGFLTDAECDVWTSVTRPRRCHKRAAVRTETIHEDLSEGLAGPGRAVPSTDKGEESTSLNKGERR